MLQIERLSVGYGARTVLRDISLDVAAGEVVAVVGPNGAGKSTLVRALSGVVRAAAGSVRLDGTDLLQLGPAERARRIAVVPQAPNLPGAFTAGELVLLGRTPHLPRWGGERPADERAARDAMALAGVTELAGRRLDEISGGERQRVLFARALAQEPRVLLLDEATAHLDLAHQAGLLRLVRRLSRERGLSVVAMLHDLNQAALFADRVALLAGGAIVAAGAPAEVITAERIGALYGVAVDVIPHPAAGTPVVLVRPGDPPPLETSAPGGREEHLGKLREGPAEWNAWRARQGYDFRPLLRAADLRGADLRGALLGGADLREATLESCCLEDANLRGADLRGVRAGAVSLQRADLVGARCSDAVLERADLRGALLFEVDFRGANLSGADLRFADLAHADLRGALLRGARLADLASWEGLERRVAGADLRGALGVPPDLLAAARDHGAVTDDP